MLLMKIMIDSKTNDWIEQKNSIITNIKIFGKN